jgi:hypothetical protein
VSLRGPILLDSANWCTLLPTSFAGEVRQLDWLVAESRTRCRGKGATSITESADSLPKLGLVAGSGCYTRCAGDLNEVVGFLRLIAVHSWFSD